MNGKMIRFIFFGNYFVGLLAVALSIESARQLQTPLNSLFYYAILFCGSVVYYTYAYTGPLSDGNNSNPRTEWYQKNKKLIQRSQLFLLSILIICSIFFLKKNFFNILHLPMIYWLLLLPVIISAVLYYGLLPRSFYKINLRNTGWLKAFVIGFVWACCANIIPFIVLHIEKGSFPVNFILLVWLFIKNWMFCTVNAIMFDIKDYAADSNRHLKTFVVSFGLRKTIYFILMPLAFIGLASFIIFATVMHFPLFTFLFNLVPFVLLIMLAMSMLKKHKILYYLVVIDGLVMLKALCGIAGMYFFK